MILSASLIAEFTHDRTAHHEIARAIRDCYCTHQGGEHASVLADEIKFQPAQNTVRLQSREVRCECSSALIGEQIVHVHAPDNFFTGVAEPVQFGVVDV